MQQNCDTFYGRLVYYQVQWNMTPVVIFLRVASLADILFSLGGPMQLVLLCWNAPQGAVKLRIA